MGEEIEDARRTVPRAILGAGVVITVLYIAATFAVLLAMPKDQVSGLSGNHAGDSGDDRESRHRLAGAGGGGARHAERARRHRWMVRGDRAAAVRRRYRSIPAEGVRRSASEVADAVRRAAGAGGDCRSVRLSRPGGDVGARRIRRARVDGHHRVFHPVPVHVRRDDRAAARAGRRGGDARAGRETGCHRAGVGRIRRDDGVDRPRLHSAGRGAEQDAGRGEGRRLVGDPGRRRCGRLHVAAGAARGHHEDDVACAHPGVRGRHADS